ncbi:MAG: hypothetical protein HYV41_03500 [Candidatus Magasanikbacteria bacterium]|nr:hypothetical protein [Candidatus Magasanikbacteria bacterium]
MKEKIYIKIIHINHSSGTGELIRTDTVSDAAILDAIQIAGYSSEIVKRETLTDVSSVSSTVSARQITPNEVEIVKKTVGKDAPLKIMRGINNSAHAELLIHAIHWYIRTG